MDDLFFSDYGLSPLSPLSDSLSSVYSTMSSSTSSIDGDGDLFDFTLDYKYDNSDKYHEPARKRVKIGVATSEMSTQTDPEPKKQQEEVGDDDGDDDVPLVKPDEATTTTKSPGTVLLGDLCYFYHSYDIDCRHFASLYSAGVLISKRLKERKYEEKPKTRYTVSELLVRVYKDYRYHNEAEWVEFHVRKLREFCNSKDNKRKDILPFIHSFVSVHLSGSCSSS